jgi:hypothetical protein
MDGLMRQSSVMVVSARPLVKLLLLPILLRHDAAHPILRTQALLVLLLWLLWLLSLVPLPSLLAFSSVMVVSARPLAASSTYHAGLRASLAGLRDRSLR